MSDPKPFEALRLCRSIKAMPDGTPIKPHLAHTLLVLATYYPNIWPGHDRLAADMKVSRRALVDRLAELEASGLIWRVRRGPWRSTVYGIRFGLIRRCAVGRALDVQPTAQEDQEETA